MVLSHFFPVVVGVEAQALRPYIVPFSPDVSSRPRGEISFFWRDTGDFSLRLQ